MKKKLLILLVLPLAYSCQFAEVQTYHEHETTQVDTLYIEQIKIKTH